MLKVVHITWEDPCFAQNGWMTQADFESWVQAGPSPSDSIGVLAYECPSFIVLVQSIGEDQIADAVKINRSAIRSIKELAEVPLTLKLNLGKES